MDDMKTDFSINVQVNLGVTPELVALVGAVLAGRGNAATAETAHAVAETATAPAAAVTDEVMAQPVPEPAEEAKTKDSGEADVKEAETAAEEAPKAPTAEDVRTAMHATRQRIEGEDYKDNTTSERYKRYHKALTAEFKNIAALFGADKPSALAEDKRQAFIDECNQLEVLADGTIGNDKLPF